MSQPLDIPFNEEAEEALLGSILIDEQVLEQVKRMGLKAADFYIFRNRWIFEACRALHRTGQPIDLVTLATRLRHEGKLGEAGGEARLTRLMNVTPTSTHGVYYARQVIDAALRRQQLESIFAMTRVTLDEKNSNFISQAEEIFTERLSGRTLIDQPDPWQIYNLGDAYKARPPLEWVVEGLISLPSVSILYGAPGTMKSILLADLMACVAGGRSWLEPLPEKAATVQRQTGKGPVLWVDFDNGPRRTHERIEAVSRARGLPVETPFYYTSMPEPWLDAGDQEQMALLARRISRLKAKMVVIDNLATINGQADENSAEVSRVMGNLRKLAERCHVAVIVIHHQSKKKGAIRLGDTLRGHSSIEAAIDLALLVKRPEGADHVELKSTKTRGVDVLPFAAQFAYEHKAGTLELAEARFFGIKPEEKDDDRTLALVIKSCVAQSPGVGQNELIRLVKEKGARRGRNTIRAKINELLADNQIRLVEAGKGHPSAYYPVEP